MILKAISNKFKDFVKDPDQNDPGSLAQDNSMGFGSELQAKVIRKEQDKLEEDLP